MADGSAVLAPPVPRGLEFESVEAGVVREVRRRRGKHGHDVQSIVGVAVGVFLERGYDGTSIADIAAEAGVGKSSIYNFVPSKEELLRLAVSHALGALFAVLEEPPAREGRAVDRLRHVLRREVEIILDNVSEVALLVRVRGNSETERWAMDQRRKFDRVVTDLIRAAAAEGDIRADVDSRVTARLLLGMTASLTDWYRATGSVARRQLIDTVIALAFEGLRAS